MKNNYPIKYAAMPIIEQTGWYPGLHELEREYGIVCYIASKYIIDMVILFANIKLFFLMEKIINMEVYLE